MSSDRTATIEIAATSNRLTGGLAAASRKVSGWASSAVRGVSSAFGRMKLGEVGKNALGHLGGNLLSGGLDMFIGGAKDALAFERAVRDLGVNANISDAKLNELHGTIRNISKETAIGDAAIVAAGDRYFALTSDIEGMADAMRLFAKTSQATGVQVETVTELGAALKAAGVSAADMEGVMGMLVAQGRAGKITLQEQAQLFVSLIPQFQRFGSTGIESVTAMNAAFQTIADDFGSASEAATGFENMMGMIQARSAKLKGVGINVYEVKNGKKQLRDLELILGDIFTKLKDPELRRQVLGENIMGHNALAALERGQEKFHSVAEAAKGAGDTIQKDFARKMNGDVGKIDKAMNDLKLTFAEAFTPERIAAFADMLTKVLDLTIKVGQVVGGLFDVAGAFVDKVGEKAWIAMTPEERKAFTAKKKKDDEQEAYNRIAGSGQVTGLAGAMMGTGESPAQQAAAYAASGSEAERAASAKWYSERGEDAWVVKDKSAGTVDSAKAQQALGGGAEALLKQVVDQLRKIAASNSDMARQGPPTIEVGRKEVTHAYENSAEHGRSPR